MKKTIFIALTILMAITANARGYNNGRTDAKFKTDRMAYELRLTDRQYHAVYAINRRFVYDPVMRDRELSKVLTARQFEKYLYTKRWHKHVSPSRRENIRHHRPHYASYKRW